ncbi:MAG: helix-turn-helix domain-containing protein [Ruminococcus sp.]|nr:MAG: helix-turn-helix domain-containing protein [Ruminococcus sp.]
MGAIRRSFKKNFTMVHNEYLNDPRLGGAEMGWLTYMLSRPDNWNFSIEGLAHTHSDGKTKIITALNKLKSFGYFRRIKLIDDTTGRIIDWVYEFF